MPFHISEWFLCALSLSLCEKADTLARTRKSSQFAHSDIYHLRKLCPVCSIKRFCDLDAKFTQPCYHKGQNNPLGIDFQGQNLLLATSLVRPSTRSTDGRGPSPLCIVSAKMTLEGNGGRADVVITRQNLILEPPRRRFAYASCMLSYAYVNAPCEVLLKVPFCLFLLAHLLRLSSGF